MSGRVPHVVSIVSLGHSTHLALMNNNTQRVFPAKEALQESGSKTFFLGNHCGSDVQISMWLNSSLQPLIPWQWSSYQGAIIHHLINIHCQVSCRRPIKNNTDSLITQEILGV